MLCGQLGELEYLDFLIVAGPIALLRLIINHAVLYAAYRSILPTVWTIPAGSPSRLEHRLQRPVHPRRERADRGTLRPARRVDVARCRQHLRIGLPIAMLTTLAATLWLWLFAS